MEFEYGFVMCIHSVCDLSNNKRRIQLSTAQKEMQATPLHARVPLCVVKRAVVSNFALPLFTVI